MPGDGCAADESVLLGVGETTDDDDDDYNDASYRICVDDSKYDDFIAAP